MNVSRKIPLGAERLPEPAEEDLHPRNHEDTFGPFRHAVEFHEAIEQRLQGLIGGRHDRVLARFLVSLRAFRLISCRSFDGSCSK
jgi:hypothetical protein